MAFGRRMFLRFNTQISYQSLLLVFLSLIFLYSSSTFFQTGYSFYVAVASYALFFVLSNFLGLYWRLDRVAFWALVAAVGSLMYYANGAKEEAIPYLSGVIYLFFWSSVARFLADNYDVEAIKKFCIFNLIILFGSVFVTLKILKEYPLATRAIHGLADGISTTTTEALSEMGCAGFGFVYGFVFVSIALLVAIKNFRGALSGRVILVFAYAVVIYFLLQAQFTTAILLACIGLLLVLGVNQNRMWITVLIGSILLIILFVFYRTILTGISTLSQNLGATFVSHKLKMLLNAEQTNRLESLARYDCYKDSIESFIKHPIQGSGTSGGHSQILDAFSNIGLFAVPYLMLFVEIFKKMKEYITNIYVIIFELAVMVLAFLNPIAGAPIISITFMLAPTILWCSSPKEG